MSEVPWWQWLRISPESTVGLTCLALERTPSVVLPSQVMTIDPRIAQANHFRVHIEPASEDSGHHPVVAVLAHRLDVHASIAHEGLQGRRRFKPAWLIVLGGIYAVQPDSDSPTG